MMNDYIKREDALKAIEWTWAGKAAFDKLKAIPAEDVVPVIRCSECIFYEVADYGDGHTKNVCRLFNRQVQSNDYCSYGMRGNGDAE